MAIPAFDDKAVPHALGLVGLQILQVLLALVDIILIDQPNVVVGVRSSHQVQHSLSFVEEADQLSVILMILAIRLKMLDLLDYFLGKDGHLDWGASYVVDLRLKFPYGALNLVLFNFPVAGILEAESPFDDRVFVGKVFFLEPMHVVLSRGVDSVITPLQPSYSVGFALFLKCFFV